MSVLPFLLTVRSLAAADFFFFSVPGKVSDKTGNNHDANNNSKHFHWPMFKLSRIMNSAHSSAVGHSPPLSTPRSGGCRSSC